MPSSTEQSGEIEKLGAEAFEIAMGKYNKEKKRRYYLANQERIRRWRREHYLEHRDEILSKNKKYREENKKKLKARRKGYQQKYYQKNRERIKEKRKKYYLEHKDEFALRSHRYDENNQELRKAYRIKYYWDNKSRRQEADKTIRMTVLKHYGGDPPKCACCRESEPEFLALDHIKGGGSKERKELKRKGGRAFYQWLIWKNYPPGYQVLCHNCNMAKAFYGYCPHQKGE